LRRALSNARSSAFLADGAGDGNAETLAV
jgi:hypothetical protein